jgi:hypothetical protein
MRTLNTAEMSTLSRSAQMKEMKNEGRSMLRNLHRRPAIPKKAAPPRPRSRFMIVHVAVFAAALLLAAPHEIEGLALARRTHKMHFVPMTNTQKSHDQRMTLKSSASSSIEIPATIDSQRSLSRVQSRVVKALMVTYIASMCVALPA